MGHICGRQWYADVEIGTFEHPFALGILFCHSVLLSLWRYRKVLKDKFENGSRTCYVFDQKTILVVSGLIYAEKSISYQSKVPAPSVHPRTSIGQSNLTLLSQENRTLSVVTSYLYKCVTFPSQANCRLIESRSESNWNNASKSGYVDFVHKYGDLAGIIEGGSWAAGQARNYQAVASAVS